MKKIIFLFFVLFSFKSFAQETTSFQKLLAQFSQAYFEIEKQKPSNNYFGNLTEASKILHFYNDEFKRAKKELKFANQALQNEELFKKLTDSILHVFADSFLWENLDLSKYEMPLQIALSKSCPCYTELLQKGETDLRVVVSTCDQQMQKDQVFMTRLSISLSKFSVEERSKLQSYISRYAYHQCKAINNAMNEIIIKNVSEKNLSFLWDISIESDVSLMRYWIANKKDSLEMLFNNYKDAANDIKKAQQLYKNNIGSSTSSKPEESGFIFSKVFIDKNKIFGKVIYKTALIEDAVKVLSFSFVPAEKMSNIEKRNILEEQKLIPPPIEEIKIKN